MGYHQIVNHPIGLPTKGTKALRTYVGARKLRHSLQLLADLATQRAATAAKIAGNAAVQTCQRLGPTNRSRGL